MTALGRVIGQKYRMLYPLGRGGMGAVWVAEHIELGMHVAVKFIDPRFAEDERARKRFKREARAAAALQGSNVVQVFDYGIADGDPYIVMELLEGETLGDRLARETQLTVEETLEVVLQAGRALGRAHEQGIVHRDLKPENIFLANDGSGFSVKLLDFGVAKLLGEHALSDVVTQPGNLLGTLNYMSPEQLRGSLGVNARTDVWAFGVVTFECLTGELPIARPSTPELIAAICNEPFPAPSSVAEVPPGFDAWFAHTTQKDPANREVSMAQLTRDFATLARDFSGKCVVHHSRRLTPLPRVTAYRSSEERERQRPSSIPAAINGRRDINHIALIASIASDGAVLWTRHRATRGQKIALTLHFDDEAEGKTTLADVVSVSDARGNRPDMWPFEVSVRFAQPMVLPRGAAGSD